MAVTVLKATPGMECMGGNLDELLDYTSTVGSSDKPGRDALSSFGVSDQLSW
jgi:hypothetical protein